MYFFIFASCESLKIEAQVIFLQCGKDQNKKRPLSTVSQTDAAFATVPHCLYDPPV